MLKRGIEEERRERTKGEELSLPSFASTISIPDISVFHANHISNPDLESS
jgi:hypothetical protein